MQSRFRLLLLGSVLLLSACGKAPPPAPVVAQESDPAFVGSDACKTCHDSQFSDWQGSHHDLAMQIADASTVLGDFSNATFDYFDTTSRFFRDDDRYIVRTENADGELEDFKIKYTFGVEPLQQYLVEFANGHLQPLPFAWDARDEEDGGQRWYHLYPDEYIGPDDPLYWTGHEQNWNYMCAECHSTNVDLNYDTEHDSFETTWSEINVGCEACHGPASKHVEKAQTGTLTGSSGLIVDLDDQGHAVWQMNLQTGIAERSQMAMRAPQQPESCGRCHARRGLIVEEYEYGQPLADTHRLSLLREPLYFADGQIRDEVFVYGSFLQSRMYRAGVTCSDCHNPHSAELVTGDDPDNVCAQCHLVEKFASTGHHRHEPGQVACVDCHMPARVYMGVDARRDHSIRVPRPDLSLVSDAPNACTGCHADQSNEWAARHSLKWWEMPEDRGLNDAPGIVRATVLANLPLPLQQDDAIVIEAALGDGDPLVRMGALQAARGLPPQLALQLAAPLLDDRIRSVRIEAAAALAPVASYLPAGMTASFAAAADEFRSAQLAIASQPAAHAALAEFEAGLGNMDKALMHSGQALKMAPNYALFRHSRGLLLVRAGRSDEALVELAEAVRLDPDVSRYTYVYAVALNSLGQPAEAIDLLEEALVKFPADFDVAWALATMLRDNGDIERASEIAGMLSSRFPDNQDVIDLLGSLGAN
jgi:tetratricopeptide (TPR) repeat protein